MADDGEEKQEQADNGTEEEQRRKEKKDDDVGVPREVTTRLPLVSATEASTKGCIPQPPNLL